MDDTRESTKTYHPIPKLISFYMLSTIIVVIAILITFTNTNFIRILFLKTFSSHHLSQFQELSKHKQNPNSNSPNCVQWMAPFFSGGGYSSEAWSYITALRENNKDPSFKMSIYQHGDLENLQFWAGLSEKERNLAIELSNTECETKENTIVICHSEPGAWYPPLFQTLACPPGGYGHFRSVIGRTMFETDRLNIEHVRRCNKMNSVWVPTDFHVSTFIQSGVNSLKVAKIVQPVDVKFFNPVNCEPLDLRSRATQVLGSGDENSISESRFLFLSIFKWEYRKGWDVLLHAYLKEFSRADDVALYLVTNPYHSDKNFGNKILDFIENSVLIKPVGGWAPVFVIDTHIPQVDLPRLYKSADAFVLPTRGEGWGRPIVEAMAMALPVIVTNWSGPTEYLNEENSYLLEVDHFSEVSEGPFRGHLWAEPSVDRLRFFMRHVMRNPEEGESKGRKAREDMIGKYSPEIVAGIVTGYLEKFFNSS